MKTLEDCMQFASNHLTCYLATAEGDQPRVRALGFWFADETGFYFQTGDMKDITRQLQKNPKTEVCFYARNEVGGDMLRIAGEVEFVTDKTLKEKAIHDRPFLKSFGMTADSPELIIFRIAHGEAHFWTMENNFKPKEYIRF